MRWYWLAVLLTPEPQTRLYRDISKLAGSRSPVDVIALLCKLTAQLAAHHPDPNLLIDAISNQMKDYTYDHD